MTAVNASETWKLGIAGLMSDSLIDEETEDAKVRAFELVLVSWIDPFMTLSFMSLPVIRAETHDARGVRR